MASFDAIFATAEAHGLRLNSLCQLNSGVFRTNFRVDYPHTKSWFGPISENIDARLALEEAMSAALQRLLDKPAKAPTVVCEHRRETEQRGMFD